MLPLRIQRFTAAPLRRNVSSAAASNTNNLLGLYPQPSMVFTHGEKSHLFDSNGNKYLDFNSGIAVNALGHNDKDVVNAIKEQAGRLIHLSNLYKNEYGADCAGLLVKSLVGGDAARQAWWGQDDDVKVFLCNSGTEANEAALKFARKQARVNNPENPATGVLSFTNAFHGRSMGALSATPNLKYQAPFAPLVPGFVTSPYNDVAALENVDFKSLCAVIVEPMQGEGGVFPASTEFLEAVRRKCDEVGALLIFDEIQCGIGRSGRMFMHQWGTVNPDLITLAKPIANGIPMGATVLRHTVAKNIKPGDHGTTFGGGPLATRVACVVLEKISNPSFLQNVQETSQLLFDKLQVLCSKYPKILKEVRGKGLLVGLQLQGGAEAGKFADLCREKGNLLVISAGLNTVRMAPPLVITKEEVESACRLFEEVAKSINEQV
ncbi:UNVERIFIED_CONTAM: acetylornithine aminotransferase [Siphonaria sp. JEL0065]|nr:acetylornithine aminotransferase [Siphonaria sp. JEL0065]